MIGKIFQDIQNHLAMLDLALECSKQMTVLAENKSLEEVVLETENRDRVVNIVAHLQQKIENQINLLDPRSVTHEEIQIIKAWFADLVIISERMFVCDQLTVEFLGQQKDDTSKEIALIFKNKEVLKSYNQENKK